jgi:myo-inositol-1(or 4)-monophosphatase
MHFNVQLGKALEAAQTAGGLLRENYGREHHIHFKGPADMVTETDRQSEELIARILRDAFPDYGFWGEERGQQGSSNEAVWVVDPLDGTTNFAHRYPFFAVSIGLVVDGEVQVGVVYNPMHDEMFAAQRGGGATCNGRPIQVSTTAQVQQSLIASGYPYDVWSSDYDNSQEWHSFLKRAQSLRCDGAAALDLCYVADGRLDGYWELTLKPWDIAAGAVIVEEAGGRLSQANGEPAGLQHPSLVASNGHIHPEMLRILKKERG